MKILIMFLILASAQAMAVTVPNFQCDLRIGPSTNKEIKSFLLKASTVANQVVYFEHSNLTAIIKYQHVRYRCACPPRFELFVELFEGKFESREQAVSSNGVRVDGTGLASDKLGKTFEVYGNINLSCQR